MKKTILIITILFAFIGCKPKQEVVGTKLDFKSEVAIKGNWEISEVSFVGSNMFKITSFDVADSKCFVGSKWQFISNNNKGNFALESSSCTSFTSPITWYINKDGKFVMKILNENKAKKVVEGYVLSVQNQSDSSFELVDRVNIGGKMTDVVYHFNKI